MSDALEQTRRRMEAITMRELRRENARLIDAIDDILAAYWNGNLAGKIQAARELIEDMGPEATDE